MRTPPLASPKPGGAFCRGEPWNEGEENRGNQCERNADPQERRIDGEIKCTHGKPRCVPRQNRHERSRQRHTQERPGRAQHEALSEERAAERPGTRAERRANRQLTLTPHRARKDQVGDVGARNHEDQRRRSKENQEDRSRRRDNLIPQTHRVNPEVRFWRIRLRMFLPDGAVNRAQLGPRSLEIHTRGEPAEQFRHPVHTAVDHRRVQVMRARDDVRDHLGLGRIRHGGLENPDDRRGALSEPHRLANDRRVAREGRAPEPVRQHRRARRPRSVISRTKQPTENGTQPHDLEVCAPDDASTDDPRFAKPDHRERDDRKVAE